jgi:hypothetical protein
MAQITIISHWCKLIENLQMSSLDFYNSVEKEIKRREVPETETSRVEHHQGGALSDKRVYLRVERKNLTYDICAAPFGTGFFVSSWYGKTGPKGGFLILFGVVVAIFGLFPVFSSLFGAFSGFLFWLIGIPTLLFLIGHLMSEGKIGGEEAIMATPILGFFYDKIYHPMTYYKFDTIAMYQATIHAAVMEAIDEMTNAKGVRPLTELERKPVIKNFFAASA